MWSWDQGRLEYFQFDELRKIAKFGIETDLRQASRAEIVPAVGLPFLPDDDSYPPWRNYGRLFQVAMIAVPGQERNLATMTELGKILADDGKVTSDEYLHFIARATTQPSPALKGWDHTAAFRYPLLFVLRFLLASTIKGQDTASIAKIVSAYGTSGFRGDESEREFLSILDSGYGTRPRRYRQASESIKVLAQLSYLTAAKDTISVSLAVEDAHNLFRDLKPVEGTPLADRAQEVLRRAKLFPRANAELGLDYRASIVGNVKEAGFSDAFHEGWRVRRTHLSIERNRMIRRRFFEENPSPDCDLCGMDTRKTYPWTSRLLEVHHLLPLCSGARTSTDGTLLEDLVANCPSCHRAVHKYYDQWLGARNRLDFVDKSEAKGVYTEAKHEHRKAVEHG